jgi:hypothetical protein
MSEMKISKNFETPKLPESSVEKAPPRLDFELEKFSEEIEERNNKKFRVTGIKSAPAVPPISERRRKDIEKTLSLGLEEIYFSMSPEKRAEFKKKGEDTAFKINKLLEKTMVNLGKVVNLIKKWLALIPGVNKFFLEQEAKIRADKIFKMKNNKL